MNHFSAIIGGLGLLRLMIPDTDLYDISMPSFSNSQWILGAAQVRTPRWVGCKPIVVYLDERQLRQTLIWKCLKRNGINVYEYLRRKALVA